MANRKKVEELTRTRILATLGPASWSPKRVEELINAGASAFRLNFSHSEHAVHAKTFATVRRVARRMKKPIAILQDLQGPKIRTGGLTDGQPVPLAVGDTVKLTPTEKKSRPGLIATGYKGIVNDVEPGDRVLLDDGHIELRALEKTKTDITLEIVSGGLLYSNKGINLPGVQVSAPSLTRKDHVDVAFGLELGVDFVALSFVRSAKDVKKLRSIIKKKGRQRDVAIIAKIEKPEAIEDLDAIIEASDGIMVARGDLGVEVPSHQLPVVQKDMIARARHRGRIVITATQMLESMTHNPRPTRAETSDVANAIFDGTDAVMLSGETAAGQFPVEAVTTMTDIARYTENSLMLRHAARDKLADTGRDVADATVHAACTAAREIGAAAIVAFSSSGRTCYKVSFARPNTRLIGATFHLKTYNRLALCHGVTPLMMKEARSIDDLYYQAERLLLTEGLVRPGDLTVLVTGSNMGAGGTNSIKIHRAGVCDHTESARSVARFHRLYKKLGIRH